MNKKEMQLYIDDLEADLMDKNEKLEESVKNYEKMLMDGALALFKHMCPAKFQIGDEIDHILVLDVKPVKTSKFQMQPNIFPFLIEFLLPAFGNIVHKQRLDIEHEIAKYAWKYRVFDKTLNAELDMAESELKILSDQKQMVEETTQLAEKQLDMLNKMQEKVVEYIAAICHEANRAYCKGIGDNSQPSWDDAPDWQKNSAIDGVKFHIENPEAGAEGSHNNWMKQKKADGWHFGLFKDPEKKEHPCMVPYDKLSPEQQIKDSIFIGLVHSLYFESGLADKSEPVFQKVVEILVK